MRLAAPAAYAVSAALHGALVVALARLPPPARGETVAVEIVAVAPPPADVEPPPPAAPEPPPAAPEPPAPRPREAGRATPRATETAPPPPNAAPPAGAARAPVRFGVSMSVSTTAGGMAAPAGNTLYGELPRTAPDPADVKPYAAPRYLPPTDVTTLPRAIGACRPPPDEYPPEAVRLGIEGKVVVRLLLDETGRIAAATVVEEPGHGLGLAAIASLRRHCRFVPGRRGEENVATEIRYTVRYELP